MEIHEPDEMLFGRIAKDSKERFPMRKGSIEGVNFINGMPVVEKSDMPSISFEWIERIAAQQRAERARKGHQVIEERTERQ